MHVRTTLPVILSPDPSPGATLVLAGTFDFSYGLPEDAFAGSVKLRFVSPGPDAYPVADPSDDRVVTFRGDFEDNSRGELAIAIDGAALSTLVLHANSPPAGYCK